MQVYFYQISLLLLILIINCVTHSILIQQPIDKYFLKTSKKLWLSNIKTIIIWAFGATLVYILSVNNFTALIPQSDLNWKSFLVWFTLIFFTHGIYIYFAHRALHEIKGIRKYHGFHHVKRTQSPLTSWDIHPVEALIDTLGIVLMGFLFPAPLEVYVVYTFYAFQINIWAHFTLSKDTNILFRTFINIMGNYRHHDIHHVNPHKNYGAFILLDWLFKTQTNEYPSQSLK